MDEERKYAILDTDFVSKANIIKTESCVLADEVLAFPGYSFFCHQKMREELSDHGTGSETIILRRPGLRIKLYPGRLFVIQMIKFCLKWAGLFQTTVSYTTDPF